VKIWDYALRGRPVDYDSWCGEVAQPVVRDQAFGAGLAPPERPSREIDREI
jgi:hypothetical protein